MLRLFSLILITFISILTFGQSCDKTIFHFKSNQSEIVQEAKLKLDSLASTLDIGSLYYIEFYGHTDSTSNDSFNLILSNKRATNANEYLRSITKAKYISTIRYFGESRPISADLDKNRRVEMLVTRLNTDSTASIFGDNGEEMLLPFHYIKNKGFCNLSAKINTRINGLNLPDLDINLDTSDIDTCIGLIIKIPFDRFDESILKSRDLFYYANCKSFSFSLIMHPEYGGGIRVEIDRIASKVLVIIPCFRGHLCCDPLCTNLGFYFLNIDSLNILYKSVDSMGTSISPIDTVYPTIDSVPRFIYPYSNQNLSLQMLAIIDGNLAEYDEPFDKLIYNKEGSYQAFFYDTLPYMKIKPDCVTGYIIDTSFFHPILNSKRLVKIKVPRNSEIDSIGFRLKPSGYFIPMNKIDPRCYEHLHIKSRYDIAVYHHNIVSILKKNKLKKVKKRGYLQVRRKDLK